MRKPILIIEQGPRFSNEDKFLIFKSESSGAVYSWHVTGGTGATVIKGSKNRQVGDSYFGIAQSTLANAYNGKDNKFLVGDATYIILSRI